MKKLLLTAIVAGLLTACAAAIEPSQQQLAAATYPDPMPPSQFEKAIKEWAVDNLVDPDSANIRSVDTTPARKGWIAVCTKIDPSMGNCMTRMFYFGHIFNARINAKISMAVIPALKTTPLLCVATKSVTALKLKKFLI